MFHSRSFQSVLNCSNLYTIAWRQMDMPKCCRQKQKTICYLDGICINKTLAKISHWDVRIRDTPVGSTRIPRTFGSSPHGPARFGGGRAWSRWKTVTPWQWRSRIPIQICDRDDVLPADGIDSIDIRLDWHIFFRIMLPKLDIPPN